MSFVQRQLSFQISLANGSFGAGGNSATISNCRAVAKITNSNAPAQGSLSADIFGLPLSLMNQLTTLGTNINLMGKNTITVQAGDDTNGMTTVFTGNIDTAFADAQSMPEVSFHLQAHAMSLGAVQPIPPTSVQGSGDVAQIISGIAGQMGLQFENNGVTSKISNPYLSSSGWIQAISLAEHAGISLTVENGTMAIWPAGGARSGGPAVISPETGMVGYPAYYSGGIIVRTLFDPSMGLKQGGNITVQSDLTPANGTWNVVGLELDLESQVPRGEWFAIMTCSNPRAQGPA